MKHINFFTDFLSEEVNLNRGRLDRLRGHVIAVGEFLSDALDGFQRTEVHGSYGLGTIIKPVSDREYDADVLLYMSADTTKTPRNYIDVAYDSFRSNGTYRSKVRRGTRCVTLDYAGDFHLDVVPCIEDESGRSWICNHKTSQFESNDGTGYREWFNERSARTKGHLKRAVRLLKYLRDHKGTFSVKSILLTTLAGNTVRDAECLTGFGSLPDALRTVSNLMNGFLRNHPDLPSIVNPVLPEEDFTRHWDPAKYSHFRTRFDTYTTKIENAFECTDNDESVDKWREILGDAFGSKRSTGGSRGVHTEIVDVGASRVVAPRKPYAR